MIVLGPAPAGTTTERGLRPIVGQVLELYVCITPGQCFTNPGNPTQIVQTNAEGRATFELSISIVNQGSYVLIDAVIGGVRCRLLLTPRQLAVLAGLASGGSALGVVDDELNVDPLTEAAARLLQEAGANSYGDAAIEALFDAVDAANASTSFDGLTVAAANDRAEMTAENNSAVQSLLEGSRLCAGDCDGNGTVVVNELVTGVNIALSRATVGACAPMDTNASSTITVEELVTSVNRLLGGCP